MSEHGELRVTHDGRGVACVQMIDSDRNNALGHQMVDNLTRVFAELGCDEHLRAIVLTGLPEVFSSGASFEVLDDLASGRRAMTEVLLPLVLLDCPLPCLAAMSGYGLGGGFVLGLAGDVVLMARESRYSLNFLDLGFTPGMGATVLLEHVLSPAIAHELLFSGEGRLGVQFEGRSGVNYILSREEVLPKALDVAQRIAEKPRYAVVALKRLLSASRRELFEVARVREARMHEICFAQPGMKERFRRASMAGRVATR
jgi:4-carboxy-3-alkylbut-2-enoyl-[acp] decarboxylase